MIQENAPENEILKIKVVKEISKYSKKNTIIASSSSGLLPSNIQSQCLNPKRLIIAHPFNPVYLLPLVELVPGKKTDKKFEDEDFLKIYIDFPREDLIKRISKRTSQMFEKGAVNEVRRFLKLKVPNQKIFYHLLWKICQKILQNFRPPSAARNSQLSVDSEDMSKGVPFVVQKSSEYLINSIFLGCRP